MRGRKPTPTAILKARGSRRANGKADAGMYIPEGVPTCPEHVVGPARDEWDRLAPLLDATQLLSHLDRGALAAYCVSYGRWVEAEAKVREMGPVVKSPNGFPIQNPYLPIANTAHEQVRKLAVEFGLTPSSRSRAATAAALDTRGRAPDPLEAFKLRTPGLRIAP